MSIMQEIHTHELQSKSFVLKVNIKSKHYSVSIILQFGSYIISIYRTSKKRKPTFK